MHDFARFSESLVYVSHMEQGECNCLFDIFLAPSSLDAALKVDVDHVSMQQPVVDFSSPISSVIGKDSSGTLSFVFVSVEC